VCVCVCVCERVKNEKERERKGEGQRDGGRGGWEGMLQRKMKIPCSDPSFSCCPV
jgi:hypothetical protein